MPLRITGRLASKITSSASVTRTNYTAKGSVPQPVQEVSGPIVVSYQAKSAKAGRVLDSDNVTEKVSGEYEPSSTAKTVTNALKEPLHAIHPGSRGNELALFGDGLTMSSS